MNITFVIDTKAVQSFGNYVVLFPWIGCVWLSLRSLPSVSSAKWRSDLMHGARQRTVAFTKQLSLFMMHAASVLFRAHT